MPPVTLATITVALGCDGPGGPDASPCQGAQDRPGRAIAWRGDWGERDGCGGRLLCTEDPQIARRGWRARWHCRWCGCRPRRRGAAAWYETRPGAVGTHAEAGVVPQVRFIAHTQHIVHGDVTRACRDEESTTGIVFNREVLEA